MVFKRVMTFKEVKLNRSCITYVEEMDVCLLGQPQLTVSG